MTNPPLDLFSSARAGFTAASMATVFGLARRFIAVHTDTGKTSPPTLIPIGSGLPTVQEGDEQGDEEPKGGVVAKKPVTPVSCSEVLSKLHTLVDGGGLGRLAWLVFGIIGARAVGEIFVFKVTSQIEECIVKRGGTKSLSRLISILLILGVPVAVLQQLSHFLQNALSSKIRESLTTALMQRLVLSPHNLCHPEELVDAERLEALMADVNQTSQLAVSFLSDRIKRIFEVSLQVGLLVWIARHRGGWTKAITTPALMLVYLVITVGVVGRQKIFKAQFARKVAERESLFKKVLARLHRHRDAIAVWQGGETEMAMIARLVSKTESAKSVRDKFEFLHNLLSVLFSRVGGTALGFALIGREEENSSRLSSEVHHYFWTGRIMLQLCNSASALIEEEVHACSLPKLAAMVKRLHASLIDLPQQLPPADALPFRVRKSNICLSDVTAASPSDGTVLFQSLSFELQPGGSLLVHGNKGCGKSALLRLVAGTWPAVIGEISRPKSGVYCLLSKPYLMLDASLKEQIIYPDSIDSLDTESLNAAIQLARVSHLFSSGKGANASALLSDADQQKLMIARLIYHKPKFALLDDFFKSIEIDHFRQVLMYLRNELNAGVIVACSSAMADSLKSADFGFAFDLELILPSGKQPPRHEIIVRRA